ncbi:hypothetical protein HDV04_005221 [Boothiomyces sp. JEL0838]|nr:hypothetical protein HDV04_005221 [Boothiomyces sp. JEL0838]
MLPVETNNDEEKNILLSDDSEIKQKKVTEQWKVIVWMVINLFATVGIVFTNKAIFTDSKLVKMPITFTAFHFACTSFVLMVTNQVGIFNAKPLGLVTILPLCLAFCGNVIFPNLSLAFSSVSFYQLVRILLTPGTAFLNYAIYNIKTTKAALLTMIPICFGVGLTVYYDALSNTTSTKTTSLEGAVFALVGVSISCIYTIWIGTYSKTHGCSSLQLLYNQAPPSALMLMVIAPFTDTFPSLSEVSSESLWLILLSGILAMLINVSQFYIIHGTSALTSTIVGHTKTCSIIALGWMFGARMNDFSVLGILIAVGGIFAYSSLPYMNGSKLDSISSLVFSKKSIAILAIAALIAFGYHESTQYTEIAETKGVLDAKIDQLAALQQEHAQNQESLLHDLSSKLDSTGDQLSKIHETMQEQNAKPVMYSKLVHPGICIRIVDARDIFYYIAQSLYDGFQELGVPVEYVPAVKPDDGCAYITFLPNQGGAFKYIAYNWEQLTTPGGWWNDGMHNYLKNAQEVWDYSPKNIQFLKEKGIEAKLVMPNYNVFMADSLIAAPNEIRTNTIMFMGLKNDRRNTFLNKAIDTFPGQLLINPPRDQMTKSKIGLNIHFYPSGWILETHRIYQFLSHKLLVISEHSEDHELDKMFEPMVTFFNTDNFVETVYRVFNMSQAEYSKITTYRLNYLKSLPTVAQQLTQTESIIWTGNKAPEIKPE